MKRSLHAVGVAAATAVVALGSIGLTAPAAQAATGECERTLARALTSAEKIRSRLESGYAEAKYLMDLRKDIEAATGGLCVPRTDRAVWEVVRGDVIRLEKELNEAYVSGNKSRMSLAVHQLEPKIREFESISFTRPF
ncbi:hypothetical protein OG333_37030 (plasmid) [Streptomyces anulatus]|uniref:hypothetical protein n=1 Tax=Streptomyces anulatus TaxID=1892 RepID=UPI002F9144E1|nr:hypothetical protein OG333_37030 [Streptomyces anulatus]